MKKVLAWAVVLALVLSSFTMAFAGQAKTSKDFSDASEINYTEAVDVMVATGIINGYPDGTFGPAKTVKRSEMAKMIACIKNGGEDVGDQYKSACPFADSKDHWAAGYIAYCASEHIIDGRSADVFDPEAEVTGTEVAKMALTSLGYDSKIQGYTGETWAAAVLKDAKKNNLFDGLDSSFVPGDPCNRESAAQILFNMLKATEVEYKNGTSVSIGDDISVVVDSDIQPVVPDSEEFGPTLEMYEDVFGGKLVADDDDDISGRPAHEWTYDGDDVGTYTDDAEFEFFAEDSDTVDAALEAYDKAVYDEFTGKKATKEVEDGDVWINGEDGWDFDEESAVAKGDKIEFFKVGTENGTTYYRVIVTTYVPAQIVEVNTELEEDLIDEGHAAEITFNIFPYGDEFSAEVSWFDDEIPGYDESTYVEDAVIAIAYTWEGITVSGDNPAIIDSYVPEELVKGAVSKIKGDTVTIGGTAYEKSEVYAAVDEEPFAVGDTEYTVYDYNGYAFASVKDAGEEPEIFYGLITSTKHVDGQEAEWEGEEGTPAKDFVRILTTEEKTEEFELALEEGATAPAIGDLVAYELDEDGKISAFEPATPARNMTGQPMKNGGVLYGKQVSEDVVAFANIGTEKAEWVIYNYDDLEAATAVDVIEYFDDESGLTVLKIGSLEEATEPTVVLGFATNATKVQNSTGDAYEIDVLVNGKADTFTTVGSKDNAEEYAALDELADQIGIAQLVKFTFDGDLVLSVEVASCLGVETPVSDFTIEGTDYDAVFYGEGTMATAGIRQVLSISGSTLNVGTPDYIDNQTVTSDAAVYYVNSGEEMVASEFSKIKKNNIVILMQLDESSSTWDTVIFTDQL